MSTLPSLEDRWMQESNGIVLKWKESGESLNNNLDVGKKCYSDMVTLLQKIQGVPAAAERLNVEITVSYNMLLLSVGFSNASEAEKVLNCTLRRVSEASGSPTTDSDPVHVCPAALQTFSTSVHVSNVQKLLLMQWMTCLMQHQLEKVQAFLTLTNQKAQNSEPACLHTEMRNFALCTEDYSSVRLVMTAKDLKDLLLICTLVAQGIEQMNNEKYYEAIKTFQEAKVCSSPRSLLARIHLLTGQSFAKLNQTQTALHFYSKAVEVDFSCHAALHQSSLLFRQIRNPEAEIEALKHLYSAVQLQSDSSSAALVSPEELLRERWSVINRVPSLSFILHTLAHTCVLNGRILDGVEYYLDLLESLQSNGKALVHTGDDSFPRIPVVYLEAAFALFKAERYSDVLVVCEDVITNTVDFTHERRTLDSAEMPSGDVLDHVDYMLWSGAAHLLQAQAHYKLKDTREAITSFTRSINQLVKVFIRPEDWGEKAAGTTEAMVERVTHFTAAKGQALAGRGLCFLEKNQGKEALRDLHLSCQISPGCKNTEMWLTEAFWRLDRKEEASVHLRNAQNIRSNTINLPLYLQAWLDENVSDFSDLTRKIEDYIKSKNLET